MQWATSDTGEVGFRMTSKAWPEARLLMGFMSISACVCNKNKQKKDNSHFSLPFFLPSGAFG